MKRRKNSPNMVILYLSYIFQKSTLLVVSLSIVLMIGILLIMVNPKLDHNEYIIACDAYHLAYMSQSIFIIGLFNGILVTTINITLIIQSVSFDTLFIASTKRTRLSISKMVAGLIVFLLLAFLECIVLYIYPLFFYDNFNMTHESLLTIPILFLNMAFLFSLESILSTVVSSIFTPMLVLFINTAIGLISSSFTKFKETVSLFLPIMSTNGKIVTSDSMIVTPIWIVLFFLLYISLYNIKDLKQA